MKNHWFYTTFVQKCYQNHWCYYVSLPKHKIIYFELYPHPKRKFDIDIWRLYLISISEHLYLTFISEIYLWHLCLTFIFDIYIWHLSLAFMSDILIFIFDIYIWHLHHSRRHKHLLRKSVSNCFLRKSVSKYFLRKSVSKYVLRKSVSNENNIINIDKKFSHERKTRTNFKNCSENGRIWATLAAPVVANSEKKTCAFSM